MAAATAGLRDLHHARVRGRAATESAASPARSRMPPAPSSQDGQGGDEPGQSDAPCKRIRVDEDVLHGRTLLIWRPLCKPGNGETRLRRSPGWAPIHISMSPARQGKNMLR